MKAIKLFVPGRLCLFGEHSDWAGQMRKFNASIVPGNALVVLTEEGIYGEAKKSDKLKISSLDGSGKFVTAEYEMSLPILQKVAAESGYFSYIAGVAAYMLNYYHIGGIELNCTKITLPQKKGLSSSAAICTLAARAFNKIYGLSLTVRGEMECAYGGEQLTQSRCGRLDQAVAYGSGIVNMQFDGDRLAVNRVKVGTPINFVFADLKAQKDTVRILADLNSAYPYPKNEAEKGLHKLLGGVNEEINREVVKALAIGDAKKIGELMIKAQRIFDEYAMPLSPEELSSPKLHEVLGDEKIREYAYGGKGVGSQGDGSVQFIAKSAKDAERLKRYLKENLGLNAFSVAVPKSQAVRKAVIPVAGRGTRMLPATSVVKKDLLPVIDFDGKAKPMLQVLVDSLRESGIEEICLVIRSGEEETYKNLLGDDVSFAYQDEALGFGQAVLQSEKFANGEPVVICLGDHIFVSNTDESVFTQLINVYEESEQLTIGVFPLTAEEAPSYGIVEFGEGEKLTRIVEKPMEPPSLFGVFMYVITPQVYSELKSEFESREIVGELQLTPALDRVTRKIGAVGAKIDGKRYDIGLPEQYRRTIAEYGK